MNERWLKTCTMLYLKLSLITILCPMLVSLDSKKRKRKKRVISLEPLLILVSISLWSNTLSCQLEHTASIKAGIASRLGFYDSEKLQKENWLQRRCCNQTKVGRVRVLKVASRSADWKPTIKFLWRILLELIKYWYLSFCACYLTAIYWPKCKTISNTDA